ncbi:DUF1343 domain-containing protein [Flavobacteriaceae bacterium S356]|uniref:DUF1343 domain-containing protein n=1 Tax=Asprobacillus argus TaxID=3076534 RepID=A0ABU3LHE5_9FLAO|nr:DUF1343 domain-containing protein [Flavobacteriaceae bacterium S356]
MVLIPRKSTYLFLFLLISFQLNACAQKPVNNIGIKTGADKTELYVSALKGKRIAIVANQTSVITKKSGEKNTYIHLVDSLLALNIDVKKVFAPEHGFRGKADAGEIVKDGSDTKTGLPIISLYGKNKKPSKDQLKGIDLVVFDIQDVGARFYTYISSLHYVMEACAESNIPVILLDRPNPNGHYIDGPVLEEKHKSFVGMHPVPIVYGMTIGEYGNMINGEKWLANGIQCDLTVIPLQNYTHQSEYSLPIKPSPNLPNDKSINLYPSLCFFEGTNVNAGRGTALQFQIYGSPYLDQTNGFSYTPVSNEGAKYPKHKDKTCYGEDLGSTNRLHQLDLSWLIKAHAQNSKAPFFNAFFVKLAGTSTLQEQVTKGVSEKEIKESWKTELTHFKKIRSKYLRYD